MTLGLAERQGELFNVAVTRCEQELPQRSVYRLLHAERDRLFPDELFADLYIHHGRRSVPPSILAVVMVLQRLEGCSDREACDRFAYDLRWRYAAGVEDEAPGFAHTVLVELRARLRRSADPDRIFRVTTQLARQLGLVGVRRVLDSAPLLDAVATQDTVSLVRGGIRGLLRVLPGQLATQVRAGLQRDDDYAAPGKPACDWDDPAARETLVDSLFRDGYRALFALRGAQLGPDAAQAAELLATVIGQDIDETSGGRFVIAEGTAPDRVISLADPQARHGHKTTAHGFDGYKGHIASDPDSEIITAAEVGPANGGDAAMAEALLADLPTPGPDSQSAAEATAGLEPAPVPAVYGDSAYGTGQILAHLDQRGITAMTKVAPLHAPDGRFAKDRFTIDLADRTVTCPARRTVAITPRSGGGGLARFGRACQVCPLATQCTTSRVGRTISIHRHEALLAQARARQQDPACGRTTARPARRWSASWRTCYAAATVGGAPACAGCCASARTSGCWLPRSTSPASPPSASVTDRAAGRRGQRSSKTRQPVSTAGPRPASDRPAPSPTIFAGRLPTPIGHQLPRRHSGWYRMAASRCPARAGNPSADCLV